ncbi:unnamed protein product [Phytophthora fragariaefolia]|uniref:Unnamed protein product n=1 Tax=Phytophthora fragariaefolia TaxID=1490495 RepID=A0A9W6XTN5_9STRA|nr:unnamed protein product [Phytophthora fragariaefolia]
MRLPTWFRKCSYPEPRSGCTKVPVARSYSETNTSPSSNVKYKPGKQNALADALSRRPDYELARVTTVTSFIPNLIRASYASDDMCVAMLKDLGSKEFEDSDKELSARLRALLHRYAFDGGLLYYSTVSDDPPRVVDPQDEDLKYLIMYEAHDTPVGGHPGREKTYSSARLHYWWSNLYKWVCTYVRTRDTCQHAKPALPAAAPLASLPVPSGCWQSISMDFVFGLPPDTAGNTGIVVFVDRLSKMAHLAAVPDIIEGEGTATLCLDRVFRHHGLREAVVSDRDLCFMAKFWTSVFAVLGTRLGISTADHPQTDGETERVTRVVEDVLRCICAETPKRWSTMLPLVEFALNNAVHTTTGYTPFYLNGLPHPRVPLTPPHPGPRLSGREEFAERLVDVIPLAVQKQVDAFLSTPLSVFRHVRDAMAESHDKQKEHADAKGRRFVNCYEVADLVLLNVVAKKGLEYTLNLPKKMCPHPVFYVGLLKPYLDPARVSFGDLGSRASPTHLEAEPSSQQEVPRGQSQDCDRAEPLADEPAGQSDRGAQPAFAESPRRDGQSPANTAPSAQERPPGHQDHEGDPTVRGELGPSSVASAASQYRHSSNRRADQRFGQATAVDSGSARAPPPRSASAGDSATARRPPPALLDEPGNRHFHAERILAKRRCRGHNQYLVKRRGYPHSENSWEFELEARIILRGGFSRLEYHESLAGADVVSGAETAGRATGGVGTFLGSKDQNVLCPGDIQGIAEPGEFLRTSRDADGHARWSDSRTCLSARTWYKIHSAYSVLISSACISGKTPRVHGLVGGGV